MESHYYTTKLVKMGKWAILPADSGTWFSDGVSVYYKKTFGVPKGLLVICDFTDGFQHVYTPVSYFQRLYSRVKALTEKDSKGLEKILKRFYVFRKKLKKEISRLNPNNLAEVSDQKLAKIYKTNRDWAHQATIYDQFGWLAEEYWKPLMDEVIVGRLKIEKDSEEYHRVLFALTVPEEISTTLEEKRAVLKAALAVKKSPDILTKESKKLAREFGWMPVFAFGEPWGVEHYSEEILRTSEKEFNLLNKEYSTLEKYGAIRHKNIRDIISKYKLKPRDLQIFTDFGLALDGRNEAEYLVSFCGYYLIPLYEEISRRLGVSVTELRTLYEEQILACLKKEAKIGDLLKGRGSITAVGYDEAMEKRTYFSPEESEKIFKFVEGYVKNVQGNTEHKGVCASSGKATGKARIINTPSENNKMQEGDILITHATTVDYLPAMKKAAAIVTEVGGLTCHAAVVSREFGIPCVVALKNAMKNFKDGDVIEVNADAGTVKIIQRN